MTRNTTLIEGLRNFMLYLTRKYYPLAANCWNQPMVPAIPRLGESEDNLLIMFFGLFFTFQNCPKEHFVNRLFQGLLPRAVWEFSFQSWICQHWGVQAFAVNHMVLGLSMLMLKMLWMPLTMSKWCRCQCFYSLYSGYKWFYLYPVIVSRNSCSVQSENSFSPRV